MQPILTPSVPFHTITMDFVLALPKTHTPSEYDCLLTMTCKFSKKIALLPRRITWSAAQWGRAIVDRVTDLDWGLPKAFISDRDPKFLSQLWKEVFDSVGTKLLYAAAYHPQTDSQSERTNATVEIALRYYFHSLEDPRDWASPAVIARIQHSLNCTRSAATQKSPNEVVTGFTPNNATTLLVPRLDALETTAVPAARIEIANAIALAAMDTKLYYDKKHTPQFFEVGDKVLLKLHKGYSIPSATSHKLHQQRVGPLEVIERIRQLAYRLKIPDNWNIHDVIAVTNLEPYASTPDPYNRPRPEQPDTVYVNGDTDNYKS